MGFRRDFELKQKKKVLFFLLKSIQHKMYLNFKETQNKFKGIFSKVLQWKHHKLFFHDLHATPFNEAIYSYSE